jgi:GDP-L-fucose synthase
MPVDPGSAGMADINGAGSRAGLVRKAGRYRANADALVMRHYNAEEHINVGVAEEVTIKTLAIEIAREVGVEAARRFDPSKSDGTPRKLTDSERLFAMSWCPKTILAEGLRKTYAWYQANMASHTR